MWSDEDDLGLCAYAGTFDALVAHPTRGVGILDWKTGSGVYGDMGVQIVAYADADWHVEDDEDTPGPVRGLDRHRPHPPGRVQPAHPGPRVHRGIPREVRPPAGAQAPALPHVPDGGMMTDLVRRSPDPDSWTAVLGDVGDLATKIARTEFVPKGLQGNPAGVAAAILTGREMNLGPMASLRGIHIVEGRASLTAEMLAARILAAGHEHPVGGIHRPALHGEDRSAGRAVGG